MSNLLTSLFVVTTVAFALLFVLDFTFGLIALWNKATSANIALQPIVSQPKIATLDWIQPQEEESFKPIDVIDLAKSRLPCLDITPLRIYKLRGESVVKVQDVCISIPAHIKRYKLRGFDVIKLAALEQLAIA